LKKPERIKIVKIDLGFAEISFKLKKGSDKSDLPAEVREALKVLQEYGIKRPASKKQIESAKNAAKARQEAAKEKIAHAIKYLVISTKKAPSAYAIAKYAGVSYNTVRKHKDFIKERILFELKELKELDELLDRR